MGIGSGLRNLLKRRPVSGASPQTVAPDAVDAPIEAPEAFVEAPPVSDIVTLAELGDAMRAAKIARVLLVGTPEANRAAGVLLARRLAGAGASTVLVDFADPLGAASDMGAIGWPEDVATMAASPSTFAHAINRDRSGRTHVLAARLFETSTPKEAVEEAAAAVLAALSQAYSRSVVVFGEVPFELLPALVDENTALVLPDDGAPGGQTEMRERLALFGFADLVTLALPTMPVAQAKAA